MLEKEGNKHMLDILHLKAKILLVQFNLILPWVNPPESEQWTYRFSRELVFSYFKCSSLDVPTALRVLAESNLSSCLFPQVVGFWLSDLPAEALNQLHSQQASSCSPCCLGQASCRDSVASLPDWFPLSLLWMLCTTINEETEHLCCHRRPRDSWNSHILNTVMLNPPFSLARYSLSSAFLQTAGWLHV